MGGKDVASGYKKKKKKKKKDVESCEHSYFIKYTWKILLTTFTFYTINVRMNNFIQI